MLHVENLTIAQIRAARRAGPGAEMDMLLIYIAGDGKGTGVYDIPALSTDPALLSSLKEMLPSEAWTGNAIYARDIKWVSGNNVCLYQLPTFSWKTWLPLVNNEVIYRDESHAVADCILKLAEWQLEQEGKK